MLPSHRELSNVSENMQCIPGKIIPFVHIDAISLVSYYLIKEALLGRTSFIGPLENKRISSGF